MKITPRGWSDFQHYKDRAPPWIRLHRKLLDNYAFHRLPVASRALAPMLWLLASDEISGVIDMTADEIAFRLRMPVEDLDDALKPLILAGFFDLEQDDSEALAARKHVAVPETETETEERQSARKRAAPVARPPEVSEQVWTDWLQLRKAKRAPVTATTVEGAREEATKAGMTLEAFLRVWCRRGSQGLEAAWLKPEERAAVTAPPTKAADDELARQREQQARAVPPPPEVLARLRSVVKVVG